MDRVIIFEDQERRRVDLVKQLRHGLKKIPILTVDGHGEQEKQKTYEDQLEELMLKMAPKGALIVCDKDLSSLGEQFIGLSGTTVATVADRLGFPLCLYARGEGQPRGEELLKSIAPWEKKRIILDYSSEERLAIESGSIFRSFLYIEEEYMKLEKKDRTTPATALAKILKHPEIEDRIALYGSGEQGLLEEIMPFLKDNAIKTKRELTRRMPRILGNWLFTSILRFPGILVSEVPAASYLNISPRDFKKGNVQELFAKAKYTGPFSDLRNWWWRYELDDLLKRSSCEDGLAFAKKKGIQVHPCNDPQKHTRAGYYCMVTENPVSDANSKSGISWFPAGSDLTRIRLDKFNELAPWVGLY